MALMQSPMASIQMFDSEKNGLRLLARRGFRPEAPGPLEWVFADSATISAAGICCSTASTLTSFSHPLA